MKSFTGRTRERRTRLAVRIADYIAAILITTGGIATIVAVSTVCFFLLWVVFPLFLPAGIGSTQRAEAGWSAQAPVEIALDEYGRMGWAFFSNGDLVVFRADNGRKIEQRSVVTPAIAPADKRTLTAWSFPVAGGGNAAFGFSDGSIQTGSIRFDTVFLPDSQAPPDLKSLKPGEWADVADGLVTRTPEGQLRQQKVVIKLNDPVKLPGGGAVLKLAYTPRSNGPVVCSLSADGKLRLSVFRERKNLITNKVTSSVASGELPYLANARLGAPEFLLVSGHGENVYVAWKDGTLIRFDTRDPVSPVVAETLDLVPGEAKLTALKFLLGRTTLISGDSAGRLRGWFCIKPPHAKTSDGGVLTLAHELPSPPVEIVSLACSARSRLLLAGYGDGTGRIFLTTSKRLLGTLATAAGQPLQAVSVAPKEDALAAITRDGFWRWRFNARHPEASFASLFLPMWYEGHESPAHVWQSSSATDDFEPKLGLYPLVFGTIKATFFSMLFGVPLAIAAAIYTSEFLKPRLKSTIKPTIELLASLPSVVLGFLAAIVFAPMVEGVMPAVLASFFAVPATLLAGAHLWQLLPAAQYVRYSQWRFIVIILMMPIGLWISYLLGPLVETWLFAGNIRLWLDGQRGGTAGGWTILFLPASALFTAFLIARLVNPWLRGVSRNWSRTRFAVIDLLKFIAALVIVVGAAYGMGALLGSLGYDARGSVLGGYVQRNALVVGFVMGFAIIPIIYTISEDALSTVPQHLRSASLGAGATPWQTAVRIIIPTAMSGLFSAVMIGLGRAVGETMIVLMAAGNTPIMEWNPFNGFRTLSANIATEMPEAVPDSTHYRTLFLAALTLFVMTFLVNTVAEFVRLRFRKRAYSL